MATVNYLYAVLWRFPLSWWAAVTDQTTERTVPAVYTRLDEAEQRAAQLRAQADDGAEYKVTVFYLSGEEPTVLETSAL